MMLNFTSLKFREIQIAKNIIFDKSMVLSSFYSQNKKSITYFTIIKGVYFVEKDDIRVGILIIDSNLKELCFYPVYSQNYSITFKEFINSLDEVFDLSDYTFSFNCNDIKHIEETRELYDTVSSVKFMCCNLKTFKEKVKETNLACKGLSIRKYTLRKDEDIRVTLQNRIFSNVKGRSELTLKDVLMEEYSPKFIQDLCFILEEDSVPIGYGQIINLNGLYYLVNFGIVPEHRRKGYGKVFFDYIMFESNRKGIKDIYLTVDNSNEAAIKLYVSQGFKEFKNNIKIKL